ncbi:hypothetical protein NA57DRAFT_66812 [Rhizodiscina lignyota]|uniref:Trafficking protein particle complex subunit 10 n=1 Tax=Rhizodiscina lignyota TaxID=1504668 RepID=A0A9P4ID33_9PEZI|nr:hypothetical protein NA57DRAFT_66812 [Rhizodiscina lignyota]
MDGPSNSSSSKVTVEYHDPAGVFPLLSAQLQARLPLRNLHWKSPSRPLRSIDSLHVELVPSQDGVDLSARPSTAASQESLRRRHQIPGLRRTPYLKVYLLRCDDSETYKNIARKEIREWIRENTPSHHSGGASSQEQHDAYEWLILHVVIPGTYAAAQPRFSGSTSSSTGTAKDRSNTTRWPGGKSTTVFEKIRSDFNSSSNSAPDRVAQIRIQNEELPRHLQFPGSSASFPAYQETPQEQNSAWTDLVAKFKTLILLSFNLRVSQYEEDIREKDAQRSLPGWNFCTFFVLKEGLAHSFEGVGLVEDALVIYDELSIGLDTVIRDKAVGTSQTDATTLLPSTEELKQHLLNLLDSDELPGKLQLLMKKPIDEGNKNYRGLILASNISIFDFKCYLFARQMLLLLRLGRNIFDARQTSRKSQEARRHSIDGADKRLSAELSNEVNLGPLAEICRRALSFATETARVLRDDLGVGGDEGRFSTDAKENFIASWIAAVVDQILTETTSPSLSAQTNRAPPSPLKIPRARKTTGEPLSTGADSKSHPARSSSLSFRPTSLVEPLSNQASGQPNDAWPKRMSSENERPGDPPTRFGLLELATHRAELKLLERRTLEKLGSKCGWQVGWSTLENAIPNRANGFHEVKIEADDSTSSEDHINEQIKFKMIEGLCHAKFLQGLSSLDEFQKLYESLSDDTVKLYQIAGQARAAEKTLGDLAIVKYDLGDFAGAASFFARVTPLYSESNWNKVEVAMLRMHAQCLKALNRKDEYLRLLLMILSKAAAHTRSATIPRGMKISSPGMRKALHTSRSWLDDDDVPSRDLLTELVEYSEELPYDVSVSMDTFFANITVEPYVVHYDDRDGFRLLLKFRHLLDDDLTLTSVSLKLVGTTAEQKKDIFLTSDGFVEVEKGIAKCWLHTNVTTYGSFVVEQIALKAKKILFIHEPLSKTEAPNPLASSSGPPPLESVVAAKRTPIFCFPRTESFDAIIHLSRSIHIDRTRSIEIECNTGWNEAESLELRLRAASAGLRLHTSNAIVIEGDVDLVKADKPRPGIVGLANVPSNVKFKIRIPFEVESHTSDILIRIDAEYKTGNGVFQFFSHAKIPIDLPLDVNVQDSFKPFALFSTFNIKTSNQKPLRLLSAGLGETSLLSVQGPMGGRWPRIVFPKKAMSLQFIIRKKSPGQSKEKEPLPLDLSYQCLDEQVEAIAQSSFAKSVTNGEFAPLRRLLVPSFVERLMHGIEPEEFTQVAYRDEVSIPPFEDFSWDEVLDAVPSSSKDSLQKWLEQWHELHGYPNRFAPVDSSHTTRQITISVSVPTVHVIPTASLAIKDYHRDYLPTDTVWPLGEAKSANLTISHTRVWCDPNDLKDVASLGSADEPMQFVYEVDANPDLWLVGGPKRGTFWQREGEDQKETFELLLIPLRKGDWAYPAVDVRPVQPGSAQRGGNQGQGHERDGEEDKAISCECYYEDAFQRVLVVPDVKSTTVGLVKGGGTILMETIGTEDAVEM